MAKEKGDNLVDEVTFDYSIENSSNKKKPEGGRTHILVVDFPDDCDEECFLITLKAYLNARSETLRRFYNKELPT